MRQRRARAVRGRLFSARQAGIGLAVGLLLLNGCRFERRADPSESPSSSGTAERVTGGPALDSVRSVVNAFHRALASGDGSRVAALAVPGATVVDQEEGVEWHREAAARVLPAAMSDDGSGLGWRRAGSDFVAWENAALFVARYGATVSGEPVPWTATETFVLERTAEGWRIRHVHRSRGNPSAGRSAGPDGAEGQGETEGSEGSEDTPEGRER